MFFVFRDSYVLCICYIYEHYERFAYRYKYVHFTYSYLAMLQFQVFLSHTNNSIYYSSFVCILWQYTAGRPHYLNHANYSWPSDRLVVSLISCQRYFTFLYGHTKHNIHNREGGGKENKQTRTWVSSKRKKGEACDTFQAFCASVGWHERVFNRNSHKATRNADSSSHVGQPGLESPTF